jgi:hypothetical protein
MPAMGLVRKTLSVCTLGTIAFRSKKERLNRVDRSRRDAERALAREHDARTVAETRVEAAEKRVKEADANAARAARKLESVKRGKRRHDSVRESGGLVVERGRRAGRRARKKAAKATIATRDVVLPRAEQLATKIGDSIEGLSSP